MRIRSMKTDVISFRWRSFSEGSPLDRLHNDGQTWDFAALAPDDLFPLNFGGDRF
jgi:hypothetical protein